MCAPDDRQTTEAVERSQRKTVSLDFGLLLNRGIANQPSKLRLRLPRNISGPCRFFLVEAGITISSRRGGKCGLFEMWNDL